MKRAYRKHPNLRLPGLIPEGHKEDHSRYIINSRPPISGRIQISKTYGLMTVILSLDESGRKTKLSGVLDRGHRQIASIELQETNLRKGDPV